MRSMYIKIQEKREYTAQEISWYQHSTPLPPSQIVENTWSIWNEKYLHQNWGEMQLDRNENIILSLTSQTTDYVSIYHKDKQI